MAEKLRQYQILFVKAKEDLVAAEYLLEGFNSGRVNLNPEIIFFHLQQCAEKLIKSLLDFNGIKFPKIHDVSELISLARENNICLIDEIGILEDLTDYAVDGRYAVIHDDIHNSVKYVDILKRLLDFVHHKLNINCILKKP